MCEGRSGDYLVLRERNRFRKGELADVLQPGGGCVQACLDDLYNEDWEPIDTASHAEMLAYWRTDLPVEPGAYLRVKKTRE